MLGESTMLFTQIDKDNAAFRLPPNMPDYRSACLQFDWRQAAQHIEGLPGGGVNIAHEAVCRQVNNGFGDKPAIHWIGKQGATRTLSYQQLDQQSNRFAQILSTLGIGRGDAVFGLCGRIPALYLALLGTLKNGSVFAPLFSAFGPEPIRTRMEIGDARVLVTTEALYRKKIASWRHQMPSLKYILLTDVSRQLPEGCLDLESLLSAAPAAFETVSTSAEDRALLHFTSGTTGTPKGAVHVHGAALSHSLSGYFALDMHAEDIYWCTADPGWVTGTSYGIIAPLCNGLTLIVDEAEFDAERWYRLIQDYRVSIWYTAPTAIRLLMKAGDELPRSYQLSSLRFLASVGEPLNPEAVVWAQRTLGEPFHDNWWQTETGAIMIANYAAMAIKPGSMGRPLPGIEAAIVRPREPQDEGDRLVPISTVNTVGELALKAGWPSMFRDYLNEPQRYQHCFSQGWYRSGDLASCDADGYFWFVGRTDDVIKSAGHLIGPFEVESALLSHPAVAEAAVIGKPDAIAGETVKAFVALKASYSASELLRKELQGHARKILGAAIAPKEIDFHHNLPKTRSGKIMRRLLKARELGLPEGDISTLESDER